MLGLFSFFLVTLLQAENKIFKKENLSIEISGSKAKREWEKKKERLRDSGIERGRERYVEK